MGITKIITILKKEIKKMKTPIVEIVALYDKSPFKVLISCILSLRTKDETTAEATKRLFSKKMRSDKQYIEHILGLTTAKIEKIIYPVGFYRRKAKQIKKIAQIIKHKSMGQVPENIDRLIELPGVGRKTANLVVSRGFNKPAICVDVHVHRILNRIGYVSTKNPNETELILREKLPKKHWIEINDILVTYGQNLCKPISPWCSKCKIKKVCKQIGISRKR